MIRYGKQMRVHIKNSSDKGIIKRMLEEYLLCKELTIESLITKTLTNYKK